MKAWKILGGIAEGAVRRPKLVLVAWVCLVVLAAFAAALVPSRLHGGVDSIPGTPSWKVERALATDFDAPFAQFVVVAVLPRGQDAPAAELAALDLLPMLRRQPDVRQAMRWPDHHGDSPVIVVGLASADLDGSELAVPRLRAAIANTMVNHPQVEALVTGHAPLNADLGTSGAAESGAGERRVLPMTLVALLLAFGAPLAALAPLVAGAAAVIISTGLLAVLALGIPLAVFAGNVAAMLGLGLGIDYALLVVWRVREETTLTPNDPEGALQRAARATAPVIGISALAVFIGLLGLACVPAQDTRSMGLGGAIVAVIAACAGLTLLPALISVMGAWRDAPARVSAKLSGAAVTRRWRTWAEHVVDRPWPALAIAVLILAGLAWPIRDLNFGLPELSVVPVGLESVRGQHALERRGEGGAWIPVLVMITAPPGEKVLSPGRLTGIASIATFLRADSRVGDVRSVIGGPRDAQGAIAVAAMMGPDGLRARLPAPARWLVSRDGRSTVLYVTPKQNVSFETLKALNAELQARDWSQTKGFAGVTVQIGGAGAVELDRQGVTLHAFPWVAAGIVTATMVALFALSGSLLIPIKAVVANALTVAGALGATVSLLEHPATARAVGLTGPVTAIPPSIPIMVFCIVFGLTMDYEVFLIARVLEAHRRGAEDREAIVSGLSSAGGVITWAAVIMGLVFGGFALANMVILKMMGLALAVGVVLDATVVRMLLVPALMAIAGRWNWWPSKLEAREPSDQEGYLEQQQ